MQVVVQGAARHVVEIPADIGDRPGAVGHQMPGVAQLVGGHDPQPSALAAAGARRLHAFEDALADDVPLHLGERGLDLPEGASRRRRGVHRGVEGLERDAAGLEVVDEGDELRSEPPEAVEVEDDEDIARAQVVEAGGEPGTVGIGPGGAVLEDAFAAGRLEGVELAVEDLAPLDGGDAGVADEAHGFPSLDATKKVSGVGVTAHR